MEKNLLKRVIETEKELIKSVESEKEKAADWLASVEHSCADRVADKKTEFEQLLHKSLEQFAQEQNREADDYIAKIEHRCSCLDNISDETIKTVVLKHLKKILP